MTAYRFLTRGRISFDNIRFGIVTCFLVLITHALAYLTHEYSHTMMAWSLGWMGSPWGIDYGHPTLYNMIFLGEVDDNVSYDPIFSSGHGISAAIIALAGPFLGNGMLYFILYGVVRSGAITTSRISLSFIYWLSLMCAANIWSYVPIRAITTHADIALAAKGLQISTWVLFPFLMTVSLYVVYHFFCKMFPLCYRKMAAGSGNNVALIIAMTSFWYFSFFGSDGIHGGYGPVSQLLSVTSLYFLFPVCAMWLTSTYYAPNLQGAPEANDRV